MEAAFEQLKKDGQNGVDSLVAWLKSSKLIDESAEAEAKAKQLFEDASDKKNVELAKFKEVVAKLGAEHQKSSEQMEKMLSDGLTQLQGAASAAVNAFAAALSSK